MPNLQPSPTFDPHCPQCGGTGIDVIACTWTGRVPLTPDGFALADARESSTEDEAAQCRGCGLQFALHILLVSYD